MTLYGLLNHYDWKPMEDLKKHTIYTYTLKTSIV